MRIQATKTYATEANAEKALDLGLKKAGLTRDRVHYLIATHEGRFFPVVYHVTHPDLSVSEVQAKIFLSWAGIHSV